MFWNHNGVLILIAMAYNDYIYILQQSILRRKSDQIYVNDAKKDQNSYEEIDLKNVKSGVRV